MRLVTFIQDGNTKLGTQIGEWILDLERAQNYLSENYELAHGSDFPNGLHPGGIAELSLGDSPLQTGVQQTVKLIQDSLPGAIDPLVSAQLLLLPGQIDFQPPVLNPGKLICVGLNYPAPGQKVDQLSKFPTLFLKANSTLTGHQQPILLPRISQEVFCEGELAVLIGKKGKHIDIEEALSHVAGYTIANDVGARDLEQRTSQWATGKLPDTFCPMGPALVTSDLIPDPNHLSIRTCINDQVIQSGNTRDMIFDVPYLISYISSFSTLNPGDIILTGSPKSIDGHPAPTKFLSAGDQITIEIEGIGVLSNQTSQED